jgi:hypothetical protein
MQRIAIPIPLSYVTEHANCISPDGKSLCKAVVDIDRKIMVIGGSMHVDEEEMLLDEDSEQQHLWGINLYPDQFGTERFVEFDSMINLRPNLLNRSRSVENPETRKTILSVVDSLVHA